MTFTTHNGRQVTGTELQAALDKVANDWAQLARDIRAEDAYAGHVSEFDKDMNMLNMVADAEKIRGGAVDNFTIWQRVNTVLTGDCVALLGR
jgi:hypothetical protein